MGNSIVSGLSTKQTEQQAARKGNEAFEKAKAAGMTDTQASKVATDEMLSMLPPDKRRQLLVDNDGERLSINFAGENGKVDRNQGGLYMSLAGDDFRSRHASLVDFISDEGLWGNNQMLGLATGLLDKRAAYYSYDSIAKRGQQAFESAAANSQARYNHINRDRIAQQRQQLQTSRQLDAINQTIYEDIQSSWFNKAKNVAEASWNLLSRTGDVSNLDSAPLWKGLAGHGDMEFRQDMSTVLTLGGNKDPRYMRWLSQVDVSQLNQMSPEKRAGAMFDMWATGVHPSNTTFSDGSPVVESLRNTNAANTVTVPQ